MGNRLSSASYTALTISVDCPACGESLPDPSGSLFWTPSELAKAINDAPNITCDSCDKPFILRQQNKAHLELGILQCPRADEEDEEDEIPDGRTASDAPECGSGKSPR